jgi:hemerythrin
MSAQPEIDRLKWEADLSVGIDVLDAHHKELILIINRLHEAKEKGLGEVLMEIVSELFNYANYHFGAEEALFEEKDYPHALEHSEQHLEFRERLGELRDMVEAGIESAQDDLLSFLNSWWTNHIKEHDKKYGPYLA